MEWIIRTWAVAQTTFRETIRNKILHHMLGFAIAMFGLAWVISNWSIGEPEKIITDLGLTITVLAGVIIAIFAGIVLVYGEVDRKTILPVIAKPLHRWEYILGKFLGFSGAVLLVYAGMNIILVLFLLSAGQGITSQLLAAIYMSMWEVELVVAIALMFSTISTPGLSALYTIMLFVTGRFSSDLRMFLENNPDVTGNGILKVVYAVIPHLSNFNFREEAVHGMNIVSGTVWLTSFYGLVYCLVILAVASLAFKNRDLA